MTAVDLSSDAALVGAELVHALRSTGRCGLPTAQPITSPVSSARYLSPLRYPGAKSLMTRAISTLIANARERSTLRTRLFVEPFAGGASTALRLLSDGLVEQVLLADADPLVACFWQAAAVHTDELVARLDDEWKTYVAPGGAPAVDRWDYWRAWRPAPGMDATEARLGFAVQCLFLNRTTFSGILHGRAGPIGGRSQASPYSIGCRWNAPAIEERVRYIGHLYSTGRLVDVWLKDWRDTLSDLGELMPSLRPEQVLLYLDPPYLAKSDRLYRQTLVAPSPSRHEDEHFGAARQNLTLHLALADYLNHEAQHRWILSYDHQDELIASNLLYGRDRMTPRTEDRDFSGVHQWYISKRLVSQLYSASSRTGRGRKDELLITTLPPKAVPLDDQFRPLRAEAGRNSVAEEDEAGSPATRVSCEKPC